MLSCMLKLWDIVSMPVWISSCFARWFLLITGIDDVSEDKLNLARECGADKAINSLTSKEPLEQGVSTIVISGANAAYGSALGMTANHGAVLAVGLPAQDIQISG